MKQYCGQAPQAFVNTARELHTLLSKDVYCTPLIQSSLKQDSKDLFLKCENLQYTHSFKFRGAMAAFILYQQSKPQIWDLIVKKGIVTCSTGNFASALAYISKRYQVQLTVIVHEWVEQKKLDSIKFINPKTHIISVSFDEWKQIILAGKCDISTGYYLCVETDDFVTLGNATLGVEILQQCPEMESIIIPYGGGNLTYSVGSFLKLINPDIEIYTVEVNTGAPFSASFKAGKACQVHYEKSFIDGIGCDFVIAEQFNRTKILVKDALVVSPPEVAAAITRLAMEEKLIVEGAGAAAVAAYLKFKIRGPTCCILSGGNIPSLVISNFLVDYSKETISVNQTEPDLALI